MEVQLAGRWFRSESRYGPLFHAELRPAHENSGKLVTLVKQQARLLGLDTSAQLVIIDGPPGIGCPVISAASGADLALIVTEPTAAAIHDMERVLEMTRYFRLPAIICINKADIYPEGAGKILDFCQQNHIDMLGCIPFDGTITRAMVNGEPVTAYQPDSPASQALLKLWEQVSERLCVS
jgi:MinD superfamily P-loop ATPase